MTPIRNRLMILTWRRVVAAIALIAALITVLIAAWLWYIDGAWSYGDMPTKGVVRSALFAAGAIACFLASRGLARRWRSG